MKKLFTFIAVICLAVNASAQYQVNGSFDGNWVNCYPWEGKTQSTKPQGTQPSGWCIANVRGMAGLGATTVGAEGVGKNGKGKSVVLTNTPNPLSGDQIVPGYMTLGTAWATAQATMSGAVTEGTADGGSFGGMEFSYHPDAIRLYYKRAHNVNNKTNVVNQNERASVIAYTWKGTWTQMDVPQKTSLTSPSKYPMIDRDRNVMFNASGTVGGAISKDENAELIASIEYYIEGDASDWTELIVPFTYKTSSTPEKLNIIIAAEDYFADRSVIGNGNQITVDDIELLYYSELASATYDGVAVNFSDGAAMVEALQYDASKLELTSNGHGAKIQKSYDNATGLLTITITAEDNSNSNTYTIQFYKKGDINNDGQVTIADVTSLVNIILGKQTDYKMPVADVNGDGGVTIADVTALVNIILGKN